MSSTLDRILSASRRHPRVAAVGALCLAAVSAAGAARLTFDTDVLGLLPRTGRIIPPFRTFVRHFGSLDELYVVFTAPEGHAIQDYAREIETWIDRLRAVPEIARVDTGDWDPSRDMQWLADRQLLLMPHDGLEAALNRFRGTGMRAALASRRDLLAVPSDRVGEIVRQDPLGLFDLLKDRIGRPRAGAGIMDGGVVTPDSRSRLLIAHPARPPYDTEFSHALFASLGRVRSEVALALPAAAGEDALPPLHVEFAGGHRIAIETEALVRRESLINTAGSLALILPLLFVVFRSLWLVAVGPLPAAVSLAIVLGLLGLAGTMLSAAATASAAMMFGLGVDGVVLLYVVHVLTLRDDPAAGADVRHLRGPSTSMLLGMWTTAATFYGLTLVDFPPLEQLGMLIGHSMVLCGILTLILVPAFLPRRIGGLGPLTSPRAGRMARLGPWVQSRRRAIIGTAAAATIALGAAAITIQINPTLDRLRSVTPGAAVLQDVAQRFGLPHDVYVILQRGPDLEALLQSNEALAIPLEKELPGIPLQAASALLPSQAAQAGRAAVIHGSGLTADVVAADLGEAAVAEGFRPESLAPFTDRLPRLLSTDGRLTYEGYASHGLSDLIDPFVRRDGPDWLVASYLFPAGADVARLRRTVEEHGRGAVLTGLPLVNQELAQQFLPQFFKGLAAGTLVVFLLIALTFRDWRLSMLSLAPVAMGLVWAAGILALAGIELDLFAVFAIVTFVGIGVDYGVHVVHRYRDLGSIETALDQLAPVILVAAAITLLGYGTLVASSYPPLRSIGAVSVVSVVTLAAASVLVLPALLGRSQPGRAAVRSHHER